MSMWCIPLLCLYSRNCKTRVKIISQILSILVSENYVRQVFKTALVILEEMLQSLFLGQSLFSSQYYISYRNQSNNFYCKSNNWFLYEMQHSWNGLKNIRTSFLLQWKCFPSRHLSRHMRFWIHFRPLLHS